ncbi:hypothetical protein [uncultured Desulfobulbus sp.]|uniref:hypothetical protein n=1 Tax=uncultured Desulfobulbus sp. TaxID=239745 RepID=UPI0029C93D60|nr:hypothetical protein [uncultured Desulfobulbus sp.]
MNSQSPNTITGSNRWKRVQIGLSALVLLTIFIQAGVPLLNREKRAEKLYIDSWFEGSSFILRMVPFVSNGAVYQEEQRKLAITKLEKALELSPGNSLYEQALIWQYPSSELPILLKKSKLGERAIKLTSYRYYRYRSQALREQADNVITAQANRTGQIDINPINGRRLYSKIFWQDCFRYLDELAASDPGNGRIYYQRAGFYSEMAQYDKMLSMIRKGNSMDVFDYTSPELPQSFEGTMVEYEINGNNFGYSGTTDGLVNYGNQLLRKGKVDEAIGVYETCCQYGIRYALQKPLTDYHISTGAMIYSKGWNELEPIYKDFGFSGKLAAYKNTNNAFSHAVKDLNPDFKKLFVQTSGYDIFYGYSWLFILITGSIFLFAVSWLILAVIRKRRRLEILQFSPWDEGWLTRIFVIIYMLIALTILGVTKLAPYLSITIVPFIFCTGIDDNTLLFYNLGGLGAVLIQIITAYVVIRQLRCRYSQHIGVKTGMLRFLFNMPVDVQEWGFRSFARMYAAQMIFLLFILMVHGIFSKATLGYYPWQPERINGVNTALMKATAENTRQMIEKASSEIFTQKTRKTQP